MPDDIPTPAVAHNREPSQPLGSKSWFALSADRLKALADPQRLKIVVQLLAGPKFVSDIAAAVGEPIVRVSHHLSVMRHAHLVTDKKQGRFVAYALHPDVFDNSQVDPTEHSITLGRCRLVLPVSTLDSAADAPTDPLP